MKSNNRLLQYLNRLLQCLFTFIFLHSLAGGAQALEINSTKNNYNLINSIEYLTTADKEFDPKKLSNTAQEKLFKHTSQSANELNIGFTTDTIWMRITLNRTASTNQNWILEIPYLGLDVVDLHMPDGSILHSGGDISAFNSPYFSRFYAFPITLSETPQTYYFKVASTYPITIPLRVIQRDTFNQTQFSENLIQALYYGGLISLLFYNLVLFLVIRDEKYLLYSLFEAVTGLAIFAGNGYGRIYLWQNSPDWDEISQSVLLCFSAGFALIFTMRFLQSKKWMPTTHKVMLGLSTLYLLLGVMLITSIYLPTPTQPIFFTIFILAFAAPCIALYASIRNIFGGIESASFFTLGWATLCIGAITAGLRIFNIVPSNNFTLYSLQISSGIEMLFFSFALANSFQNERQRRESAQLALIESKEETLQAMRLTEDRLEVAVNMRTEKLQQLLLSEKHMKEQYVRFGAMIAHEFRNPLNIIEAQTTLLEMAPNNSQDKILKRTSVIHSAINRLVNLFDQWLESDRLSQANTSITQQEISLNIWLSNLIDKCQVYHADQTILFEQNSLDLKILVDSHLLEISILNLIDNACKYSSPHSQIRVGLIRDDYAVGIFVKDQGRGIPKDMQEKILEPYIRVDQNNQTQGSGLGLSFVKRIMEAHDGRIEIESTPGVGTTVTLWLPEILT
jgi:signal transduction histidine kinase